MIPLYARPDWKQLDERFKYYPGIDVENLKEPYVLPHIHHAFYFSVSPSDFPTIFKEKTNEEYYYFPMPISLSRAEELYSDVTLEPKIIKDVKDKKCKFLVVSGMEGWHWKFFEKIPNALHEKYGFDHSDFVFATGNAKDYEGLQIIYHNWWELNLAQDFTFYKNMMLPVITGKKLRPRKFIFLNSRPSYSRIAAVTYMYDYISEGFMSLAKGDRWGRDWFLRNYHEAIEMYPSIFKEHPKVQIINKVPLIIHDGVNAEIENPVDDTSHEKFMQSYIHIVAETFQDYDPNRLFFSEKMFKPMRYMQPFILLGEPYSLAKLKDLGYKTFSDYWDESYDEILDDELRLKAALDTAKKLIDMGHGALHELTQQTLPILRHNLAHLSYRSLMQDEQYKVELSKYLRPER